VNDYVLSELKSRLLEGKTGELPIKGERKTIIKGVAKGRLVGGNLRCLLKLKEFDFFPDFKDAILMIEAFNPTPKECRQMFSELKAYGIFDDVSGIIIGHIYGMEIENPNSEQMEEIILEFIKEKPILKCQLFGHNVPNTNLPIGAKVRVDATNKKIELIEKYIE
jgi:muramoyltetrapeptide carboxypeptidase